VIETRRSQSARLEMLLGSLATSTPRSTASIVGSSQGTLITLSLGSQRRKPMLSAMNESSAAAGGQRDSPTGTFAGSL
jgi:predicted esterase